MSCVVNVFWVWGLVSCVRRVLMLRLASVCATMSCWCHGFSIFVWIILLLLFMCNVEICENYVKMRKQNLKLPGKVQAVNGILSESSQRYVWCFRRCIDVASCEGQWNFTHAPGTIFSRQDFLRALPPTCPVPGEVLHSFFTLLDVEDAAVAALLMHSGKVKQRGDERDRKTHKRWYHLKATEWSFDLHTSSPSSALGL